MAEIDKALPNDKRPEEEVAEGVDVKAEIEELKGPIEVTEDEEGLQLILTLTQCHYLKKVIILQI